MSIPISSCHIVKAATDEATYQRLLSDMIYNRMQLAYTQFPCKCEPRCTLPDAELAALNARLETDIKAAFAEMAKNAKPFVIPDKFTMPRFTPEVMEKIRNMPSLRDVMMANPMRPLE